MSRWMSRGWSLLLVAALGASACAYRSTSEPGLCRLRTIPTRPFESSRTAALEPGGLAYVPGNDELWLADGRADQLYVLDRQTGAFRARLPARELVDAFPGAGRCDAGASGGGPCSYTDRLETVLYDPDTASLYVLNAAEETPGRGPRSRPALFELRRRGGSENFLFHAWQALPEGSSYRAGAVIDGAIYVAVGEALVEYDREANRLAASPALGSPAGAIAGVGWDGSRVWMATEQGVLVEIDWENGQEVARYDLREVGVRRPRGLALGPGEILVPVGAPAHAIQVLRVAAPPTGLGRAPWAGGWPHACP